MIRHPNLLHLSVPVFLTLALFLSCSPAGKKAAPEGQATAAEVPKAEPAAPTAVSRSGLTSKKSRLLRYHSPPPILSVVPAAEKKDHKPAPEVQPEDDPLGPLISIVSPEDNAFYKSQVTVVGRLGNSRQDPDSADEVALLSYSLSSDPSRSGEIEFDTKNGTFSLDFSTGGLRGRQSLEFTAQHRNRQNSYFTLTLQDGNVQPQLTILTPKEQSQYGVWVKVSGLLTETSGRTTADAETIKSLTYLVSSSQLFDAESEIKGELPLNADGTFSFIFPGRDLSGPQTVTVTAEAWNGNHAKKAITLQKGESDIPSFSVIPGDQQATMVWDPIPLDALYSIYHTSGSSSSAEAEAEAELELGQYQPPVIVKGLNNGQLYTFRLKARIPATGDEYWSNYRKSIPLSPITLKPVVKGDYERIIISWKKIPGSSEYEVWRSIDDQDDYRNISGVIPDTVFRDTEVQYGREYYYRIKPALPGSLASSSNRARTLAFPVQKLVTGAISREVISPVNITVKGDYAFVAAGPQGLQIVDIADPAKPRKVAALTTSDARAVDYRDNYVYLADGSRGMKVIDIANLNEPRIAAAYESGPGSSLELKGNIAYLVTSSGLLLLDVSEPEKPVEYGFYASKQGEDVYIDDNYAYLAEGYKGLTILDISDPANPIKVSSCPDVYAVGVAVRGRYAFVVDSFGLKVIDILIPPWLSK